MDALPFLWVGNHPATDLCNTEPLIDGARIELLGDYEAVVAWAKLAGVVNTTDSFDDTPRETHRTLRFVRRLRGTLRAVLEHPEAATAAAGVLNDMLREVPCALSVDSSSRPWTTTLEARKPSKQLALDIAVAALDLLRHDVRVIRQCANPECVLVFLDVSKSRRRRWCDMATCGNRAKVSAHYQRTRKRQPVPRARP